MRFMADREGSWMLVDHFDVTYFVRDDGRLVCPDDTLLGGKNGLVLKIDKPTGQKYLIDGRKAFNIDEDGIILDAFGNAVKDGDVFSFQWPRWDGGELTQPKMGILQQFEVSGLLPEQRPDAKMGTAFGGQVRDKIINQRPAVESERESLVSGGELEHDLDRVKQGRIDAMKL